MKKKLLLTAIALVLVPQLAIARVGDVNGDGEVTGSDVTAIYNIILYGIEPVPEVLVGGDISMSTR